MYYDKWYIPKRYLQFNLYDGRKTLKKEALLSSFDITNKIEFDILDTVSGASKEANIIIGGLTCEKMSYLATSFTPWSKQQIRNKIEIIAGYDNNNSIIFVGDIIEVIPHLEEANYFIQVRCLTGFNETINSIKSYSFEGDVNIITILNKICYDTGYILLNALNNNYFINNYSYQNLSIKQHIRNIASIVNIDIYFNDNRIIVKEKGGLIKNYDIFKIDYNNMIGNIIPTNVGCNVKVRLNPYLKTGQQVKIMSEKFKQLNNYNFIIQTIGYKGDTRGIDWYCNLVLYKENLYNE